MSQTNDAAVREGEEAQQAFSSDIRDKLRAGYLLIIPNALVAASKNGGNMGRPRGIATASELHPAALVEQKSTEASSPQIEVFRQPVQIAKTRPRHTVMLVSFILMVLLPTGGAVAYLFLRAADQYASMLGFVVRQEETGGTIALFGGLSNMAGGTSSDTEVLYEFLRSQALVVKVDAALDLREVFSGSSEQDPVFAFKSEGSIEDLSSYWQRMVRVNHDAGSGMMRRDMQLRN